MLRRTSKWLFPQLPWEIRKQRINTGILILLVSAATGIAVVLLAFKKGF